MNAESIEISLLDFFKAGRFGFIKLGQTKERILDDFPEPDDFGIGNTIGDAVIWAYGDIEFHFDDDKLFFIYSDYWELNLSGGEKLILDKWIFEDVSKLNLLYVLSELNKQEIDYEKKTEKFGVSVTLQSGVKLFFENRKSISNLCINEFTLVAFTNYNSQVHHS